MTQQNLSPTTGEPPQKKHKSGERPVLVFEDYCTEVKSYVSKKCNWYQNSGFPAIAETGVILLQPTFIPLVESFSSAYLDLAGTKVETVRRLRNEYLTRQQQEAVPPNAEYFNPLKLT